MDEEHTTFWCFFFFSSRRRHTRLQGDWSSDVCSSDLASSWMSSSDRGRSRPVVKSSSTTVDPGGNPPSSRISGTLIASRPQGWILPRSEERRVGKEGRSRWSPYH